MSDTSMMTLELPPATRWPDSAPKANEEKVVSIVCGNTHIHWAFHEGRKDKFTPTLFWRTPLLTERELNAGPSDALSRHLPQTAHEWIYGEGASATATPENAKATSNKRKVSEISVYIVSSNEEQAKGVNYIWKDVPSRIFMMGGNDFFTKEQGRYESMGDDRLAVLYAAGSLYGFPALVFDGGTALTYSAADENGNIMGGGITLGLGAKLRSLSDMTGALPLIEPTELMNSVTRAEVTQPMDPFSMDTRSAMTVSSLGEVAYSTKSIIKHWLNRVGPAGAYKTTGLDDEMEAGNSTGESVGARMEEMKTDGIKITTGREPDKNNSNRNVCVTGGDADVLAKLLFPDHSRVIQPEPGTTNGEPIGYAVKKIKHMIHYGIAGVLERRCRQIHKIDPKQEDWESSLVGQRVAKKFPIADEDGEYLFRGTITAVIREGGDNTEDFFKIVYDDDDVEELNIEELHKALVMYSKEGEKKKAAAANAEETAKKKEASEVAAKVIADKCKEIEEAQKKKAAKAIAAQKKKAATTPAAAPAAAAKVTTPAAAPAAASSQKRAAKPAAKPPAKRAKKTPSKKKDPRSFKGRRVAKRFGPEIFFGRVVGYESDSSDEEGGLWQIIYDDDDKEEFDRSDLDMALEFYKTNQSDDINAAGAAVAESSDETSEEAVGDVDVSD